MSDSVQPHRRQPTRLPCPWDSPGKNTGELLFPSPMHESEKWKGSRSVVSDSSWPRGLKPTRLLRPWDFPGKSTGVGCHCLLRKNTGVGFYFLVQGIFPTQRLTRVSVFPAFTGRFFTTWAIWEAQCLYSELFNTTFIPGFMQWRTQKSLFWINSPLQADPQVCSLCRQFHTL